MRCGGSGQGGEGVTGGETGLWEDGGAGGCSPATDMLRPHFRQGTQLAPAGGATLGQAANLAPVASVSPPDTLRGE